MSVETPSSSRPVLTTSPRNHHLLLQLRKVRERLEEQGLLAEAPQQVSGKSKLVQNSWKYGQGSNPAKSFHRLTW